MVRNNRIGEIGFGRRFSVSVIALILLISAIPAGFLMGIGVVGENTNENGGGGDGSYYVYGYVYDPDGAPVNSSLVIITNMRTGDGNATWTDENGYYSFNLAEMNNSYQIGDEIKVTGLDGLNIGNITINIGYENPGQQADVALNGNGFEDRPMPIEHDFIAPEIPDIGDLTYPLNSTFEPLNLPNITLPEGLNLTEPETPDLGNSTNSDEDNSTPPTPNITLDSIRLPSGSMYVGKQRPLEITLKNNMEENAKKVYTNVTIIKPDGNETLLGTRYYGSIPANKTQSKEVTWEPEMPGIHRIKLVISREVAHSEPVLEIELTKTIGISVSPEEAFGVAYTVTVVEGTAPPTTYGNWEIWDTTIVEGPEEGPPKEIKLKGNLIIHDTGHLIFKQNVLLKMMCDEFNTYSIIVDQENKGTGRFDILSGSEVRADMQWYPYKFFVNGILTVKDSNIKWMWGLTDLSQPGGIQLLSTSKCYIDNSVIEEGWTHNIYANKATPVIKNSQILNAGGGGAGSGIYLTGDATKGSSLYMESTIVDNTGGNAEYGIYCKDSGAYITGSDIEPNKISGNNYGVYLVNAPDSVTMLTDRFSDGSMEKDVTFPTWDVKTEMDALPENDGWALNTNTQGESWASVSNGILKTCSAPGEYFFYDQIPTYVTDAATIEFQFRTVQMDPWTWTVELIFSRGDPVNKEIRLRLNKNDVKLLCSEGDKTVSVDTTVFHIYRVTFTPTEAKLYVDGALGVVGTPMAPGTSYWWESGDRIIFGDIYAGANIMEESEWDYIYYSTQGAFSPDVRLSDIPTLTIPNAATVTDASLKLAGKKTWSDDVNIREVSYDSQEPDIAVVGSYVHVVWSESTACHGYDIFYKHSTDHGKTWSDSIQITNDASDSTKPAIAADENYVHIVWVDDRDGNNEIYYEKINIDDMSHPVEDKRLTDNSYDSTNPDIAVIGSYVHVVWQDDRDSPGSRYYPYYKRNTNYGEQNYWEYHGRLAPYWGGRPKIAVSGSYVHVVWCYVGRGCNNYVAMYIRSSDNGANWWNYPELLTSNYAQKDSMASIAIGVSGSYVHAVWQYKMNGADGYRTYYAKSENNGDRSTWSEARDITTAYHEPHIDCLATGNYIGIVWRDEIGDNVIIDGHGTGLIIPVIYYKSSSDVGESWSENIILHTPMLEPYPAIGGSGNKVSVVWQDAGCIDSVYTSSQKDIYYKLESYPTNPTLTVGDFVWSHNGEFIGEETIANQALVTALNDLIPDEEDGNTIIPLALASDTNGKITISNINIAWNIGTTVSKSNIMSNNHYGIFLDSSSATIRNNPSISGSQSAGICILRSDDVFIKGNTIKGNNAADVVCSYCSPTIEDNIIGPSSKSGIAVVGSSSEFSSPYIKGNTITNHGFITSDGKVIGYGIYCRNSLPFIESNTIDNTKTMELDGTTFNVFGVYITGSSISLAPFPLKITGNSISNNQYGVYMETTTPVDIHDENKITANVYGIYVTSSSSPIIIDNNEISSNTGAGVYFVSSTGTVTNNQISNNPKGIYCYHSNPTIGAENAGNTISNNNNWGEGITCYEASPTIAYNIISNYQNVNIVCYGSSSPNIIYNTVRESTTGILFYDLCSTDVSGPSISSNTITYNTLDGICLYSRYGGAIRATVEYNTIESNNRIGIYGYYSSLVILNNEEISDNGCNYAYAGSGVYLYYSDATITGNNIQGNGKNMGGIVCAYSSPEIIGNTITYNNNYGIYSSYSNPKIGSADYPNTITHNKNGILCYHSSPPINNNDISSNMEVGVYCIDSSPTIENENSITSNNYGVYVTGSSSPTIGSEDSNIVPNEISSNTEAGIYFDSSGGNVINNQINNNKNGIYCYKGSKDQSVITKNTISDNNWCGVWCENSQPKITDNNLINLNGYYGIFCREGSSPTITDNVIEYNGYQGIQCEYSSPTIKDNTISNNERVGIACAYSTDFTIEENIISSNRYSGIACRGSSPNIVGNTITSNREEGIVCYSYSSPIIRGNTISGNILGIYSYDHATPIIGGDLLEDRNKIIGNDYGIRITDFSNVEIVNNIIEGNQLPIPLYGPYTPEGYGIYAIDSTLLIENNNVWEGQNHYGIGHNGLYGIYCDNCDATIMGNYIHDQDYGIVYMNKETGLISDNTVEDHKRLYVWSHSDSYIIPFYSIIGNGIYCYKTQVTIDDNNIIKDNARGIICEDASPQILNNNIESNSYEYFVPVPWPWPWPPLDDIIEPIYVEYPIDGETIQDKITIYPIDGNGIKPIIIDRDRIIWTWVRGGDGIRTHYASPTVEGNTISENYNGIRYLDSSMPTTINNDIVDNRRGYGIYFDDISFGDWTVNDVATAMNNPIRLNGNLIVTTATGDLTLDGVTLEINCMSQNGEYRIEVQGDTTVSISSSVITAVNPDYHYKFWVKNGATLNMEDTNVHYCGYEDPDPSNGIILSSAGLYIRSSDVTINGCVISDNYFGIICDGKDVTVNIPITGNTISNNYCGIYCDRQSSPTIEFNTIISNQQDGIHCILFSRPVINFNNIYSNGGYGVYYDGSHVESETAPYMDAKYNFWGQADVADYPYVWEGTLEDTYHDVNELYSPEGLDNANAGTENCADGYIDAIPAYQQENGWEVPLSVEVNSPNGGEIWAGDSSQTIEWTISEGIAPYTVTLYYSTDSGGSYPNQIVTQTQNSLGTGTYPWTVPSIDYDICKIKVTVTDSSLEPQTSEDENDGDFTIDSTPPNTELTLCPPDPTNNNKLYYEGVATDTASKVVDIEYGIVDVYDWADVDAFTPAKSVNFKFTTPALSDGTYTIQTRAKDEAYHWETTFASDTVTVDTTPPAVDAGPDVTTNMEFIQDATVSDPAPSSGIASYQWSKVSGLGTITFGSPNAEDTSVSADTDGTYVICLTVVDNAGNSAFDEFTLIWDTTGPVTTIDDIPDYVNSLTAITGTAEDGTTSVDYVELTITYVDATGTTQYWDGISAWTTTETWLTATGTTSWSYDTIAWVNGDTYTVTARATDIVGNTGGSVQDSFMYDALSPTIAKPPGGAYVDDNYVNAGTIVTITAKITDVHSDVDPATTIAYVYDSNSNLVATIQLYDDGTHGDVTAWNDIYTGQWDTMGLDEGAYSIDITASDRAGNSDSVTTTVTIDNVAPAAPTGLTAKVKPNGDVVLTWDANTETDLAGYRIYRSSTSGGPYTQIGDVGTAPQRYTDSPGTGTWYYVITAYDKAGNESTFSIEVEVTV